MSNNIKVAVRLKPLDEAKKEKFVPGFEVHGRRINLGARSYDPDIALDSRASQEDVFDNCIPIIDAVKNGSNGTIMVYGQTGTGKTYTMFGEEDKPSGIAYRCVDQLLEYVRECVQSDKPASLTVSMLEIYNEKVSDMLSGQANEEVLLINGIPRQCAKVTVASKDEAVKLVQENMKGRHVTATAMNERSSRSHVILTLDLDEQDMSGNVFTSRLVLVDLAGSECLKKSGATGKAAAEAGNINKSLLALKNVILTLSNAPSDSAKPHVPYRDSKLTELLQDSVGGTARTMLIACISAIGRDIEETKSTLEYASKARMIRNVANTERDKVATKMRGLEIELQRCKNKLNEKINERGGVWYSKEENEETIALREEAERLKASNVELANVRRQLEAKEHLVTGQCSVLRSLIKEKDDEIEGIKGELVTATKMFERAAKDIVDSACRSLTRVESSSLTTAANLHRNLTLWKKDPLPSASKHAYTDIVTTHNDRVQAAFEAITSQMEQMEKNFASQLREMSEKRCSALQSAVEDFCKDFAVKVANAEMEHRKEIDEFIDLNSSAKIEYAKKSTLPLDALPMKHAMDNLQDELCAGVAKHFPPPTLAEPLCEAFTEARKSLRNYGKQEVATAMGSIRSISDPAMPIRNTTNRDGRTSLTTQKENVIPGMKRVRSGQNVCVRSSKLSAMEDEPPAVRRRTQPQQ